MHETRAKEDKRDASEKNGDTVVNYSLHYGSINLPSKWEVYALHPGCSDRHDSHQGYFIRNGELPEALFLSANVVLFKHAVFRDLEFFQSGFFVKNCLVMFLINIYRFDQWLYDFSLSSP